MDASWGITGHNWAVEHLRRSIRKGKVAHAYLFAGPAGIGKGMLAVRLAQALVCEMGEGDPCQQCRACKRVVHSNHPDVRTVSVATQAAAQKPDEAKSRELRIDSVRDWQRDIELRPFEADRRVFILEDADKLTDQAANAMLKTLEEPPSYAVLILIAQSTSSVLSTILSRCRVLRLRPLARSEVAGALQERYHLPEAEAAMLAAWSGGRLGWAVAATEEPEMLEQQQTHLNILGEIRSAGRVARLKWAEERAKEYRTDQAAVQEQLILWQGWWRDVLLIQTGCEGAITFLDRIEQLRDTAKGVSLTSTHDFLRRIEQTQEQLAANVNPQLALENLALHLP